MELKIPLRRLGREKTAACVSTGYSCFNSGHRIHHQDLIGNGKKWDHNLSYQHPDELNVQQASLLFFVCFSGCS